MATTTNYGWTTPDDTALVKDGAAAIRTLGSSIDSTLKTQIDAQIPDSLLTTKGDIIAATGASTPTRLGVGTNGQALVANSATATGLEWASPSSGGMTLLSTTTLSGATTTISSINQTYRNLAIYVYGVTNATGDSLLVISPNGSTNITNHFGTSTPSAVTSSFDTYLRLSANAHPDRTSTNNIRTITIENYASTTNYKSFSAWGSYYEVGVGSRNQPFLFTGGIATNSAITSLVFESFGGNLTGGTVLVYGVK
jgi:hypothetical protein